MRALAAETQCAHDFVDTAERMLVHASQIHERMDAQLRAGAQRHALLRAGMVEIVNDMLDMSTGAASAGGADAPACSAAEAAAAAAVASERGPLHLSGAALSQAVRQAKDREARRWQKRRVWQVRADCARKLRDKALHWQRVAPATVEANAVKL